MSNNSDSVTLKKNSKEEVILFYYVFQKTEVFNNHIGTIGLIKRL